MISSYFWSVYSYIQAFYCVSQHKFFRLSARGSCFFIEFNSISIRTLLLQSPCWVCQRHPTRKSLLMTRKVVPPLQQNQETAVAFTTLPQVMDMRSRVITKCSCVATRLFNFWNILRSSDYSSAFYSCKRNPLSKVTRMCTRYRGM